MSFKGFTSSLIGKLKLYLMGLKPLIILEKVSIIPVQDGD